MKKHPLSELDQIRAEPELKEKTLNFVMKKRYQKSSYHRPVLITAGALICICILSYFTLFKSIEPIQSIDNSQVYSYITMDVNPSLELSLNQDDIVVEATPFNKDAETILNSINTVGMYYEEAIQSILSSTAYQQYLTDSALLSISVYSSNDDRSQNLEQTIQNYLKQNMEHGNYECHSVDEETHHEAEGHHMSQGKYAVIEQICSLDPSYSIDDLNEMSMADLRALYQKLSGSQWNSSSEDQQCQGKHRGH